ncbi:hypothetical protein BCY90_23905 [Agrobacterium deltaense]|nr:hypothetical protein BCY90_23905 [Agrobacterium deltaense]
MLPLASGNAGEWTMWRPKVAWSVLLAVSVSTVWSRAAFCQVADDYFADAFRMVQAGQQANAMEFYLEGLRLDPNNGLGHYYLAHLYNQTFDRKNAYFHFRRASELIPATEQGRDALVSRRLLARELFDHRRKALGLKRKFFEYHLRFSSRTHVFCAKIDQHLLQTDQEDFRFLEKSFIRWRMWIANKKTGSMEEMEQKYALEWSEWAGETAIAMKAIEPISKLGLYVPDIKVVEYTYKGIKNFSYISDKLNAEQSQGELSYADTRLGGASSCWKE